MHSSTTGLREMALYDGDNVDVSARASEVRGQSAPRWRQCRRPQTYVERTVDGAIQQASTDDTVQGWEG
jgi:hypothetical protein